MKKAFLFSILILILCFAFTSCDSFIYKSDGVADVKFVASKEGSTKGISTGDGANAVAFSELDGHKIRLECTKGTGYCSLSGATGDSYVDWPKETVQLGYGEWTVYAQGYKGSDKYYENTSGVEFIVGPKGVSVNDGSTWGSSVSIAESYCGSTDVQIKANTSLVVKNEVGTTVSLESDDYNTYTIKWYKTTTESPTDLDKVRTISELTGDGRSFTEWTEPGTAIDLGSYTYVAAVIVKTSTPPDTIYGMAAVSLSDLTAGSTYTIGSGSGDCVQFGKYGVEFIHVEDRGKYSIRRIDSGFNLQTSDWRLRIDDSDSFAIEKLNDDSFVILYPKDLETYYMSLYGWFPNSGNPFHAYYRDQLNMTKEDFIDALVGGDIELPKANYKQTRQHPSIIKDTSDFAGTVSSIQCLYKEDLNGYIRDFETKEAHDFTDEGTHIYLAVVEYEFGDCYYLLIPLEVMDYIRTLSSSLSYEQRLAQYFSESYRIDILDQSGNISISADDVMTILANYSAPVTQ